MWALSADWHARGKDLGAFAHRLDGLVDGCLDRRVEVLAVAGDVFDRPSVGDNHASTGAIARVVIENLVRLVSAGVRVFMIPGNHDASGVGSADALHVLDGIEGVEVVHQPEVRTVAGLRALCLPWKWTTAGDATAEETVERLLGCERVDLLLGHAQVIGMRMQGTFTCPARPGAWQLRREWLEELVASGNVGKVALGDFHIRQPFYIGALGQLSFGDEDNPQGFELWDPVSGQSQWIELDAPRFRTRIVSVLDELPAIEREAAESNDNLRMRFTAEPPADVVRRLEAAGAQVEQVVEVQERVLRAEVPEGVLDDPHGLIDLWAGAQNPPIESERCQRMHELLDRARADSQAPVAVKEVA